MEEIAYAPTTRYRRGDRDPEARAGHAEDSRRWKRRVAETALGERQRRAVVEAVARGATVPQAARAVGATHQAVYGWASHDERFAAELDEAQRAAAPSDCPHGRATGYRWYRCRCSDCRAAKDSRGVRDDV